MTRFPTFPTTSVRARGFYFGFYGFRYAGRGF